MNAGTVILHLRILFKDFQTGINQRLYTKKLTNVILSMSLRYKKSMKNETIFQSFCNVLVIKKDHLGTPNFSLRYYLSFFGLSDQKWTATRSHT